jgi:hypothetical protein
MGSGTNLLYYCRLKGTVRGCAKRPKNKRMFLFLSTVPAFRLRRFCLPGFCLPRFCPPRFFYMRPVYLGSISLRSARPSHSIDVTVCLLYLYTVSLYSMYFIFTYVPPYSICPDTLVACSLSLTIIKLFFVCLFSRRRDGGNRIRLARSCT